MIFPFAGRLVIIQANQDDVVFKIKKMERVLDGGDQGSRYLILPKMKPLKIQMNCY